MEFWLKYFIFERWNFYRNISFDKWNLTWSNERVPFIDIAKRFFSNKTWTNEKYLYLKSICINLWINLVEKMNLKVVWMKLGRPLFKQDPVFCSVVLICVIHILEMTFKYSLSMKLFIYDYLWWNLFKSSFQAITINTRQPLINYQLILKHN